MLMFRSDKAEQNAIGKQLRGPGEVVLGAGLKSGAFTEDDKQAYIEAWSQPGALTGD